MHSVLPVALVAVLLLLHASDGGRRPASPLRPVGADITVDPEPVPLLRAAPAGDPAARPATTSPLFDDFTARRPAPDAIAVTAPPAPADESRLLAAVAAALPRLGGVAEASWGPGSAVGPVLRLRWHPGIALRAPDEVRDAVVAAVETAVQAMDTAFPDGFRGDQGTPLAAVQVVLPDHDPVLMAVRTYRELAAGETSLAQLPGQWRLLGRAAPRPTPVPRLVPDRPTTGAPERWPPQIAQWYAEVLHAALVYQLDPDLLAAIMQIESGGRAEAVGVWAWIPHMGRYERAIGMMQVMPNEAERRGVAIVDAWEPDLNVLLGARVLRDKLNAVHGEFWTRVQGYYGFGDPLSDYWLDRVYAYWLAFRDSPDAR